MLVSKITNTFNESNSVDSNMSSPVGSAFKPRKSGTIKTVGQSTVTGTTQFGTGAFTSIKGLRSGKQIGDSS